MFILFFMIGVSLTMALGFLGAFVWSMQTGQHDDLYTPGLRILPDDEAATRPATKPLQDPIDLTSFPPYSL